MELVYTSKSKDNYSFTLLNINNQEIQDPNTKTEAFNEFFCGVADNVQQILTKPSANFIVKPT